MQLSPIGTIQPTRSNTKDKRHFTTRRRDGMAEQCRCEGRNPCLWSPALSPLWWPWASSLKLRTLFLHCEMGEYLLSTDVRHWFSKCGPQTGVISIIEECVRNANSQDPAQTYCIYFLLLHNKSLQNLAVKNIKDLLFQSLGVRNLGMVAIWTSPQALCAMEASSPRANDETESKREWLKPQHLL